MLDKIIYNLNTFGYTLPSLRSLRNTLARLIDKRVIVFQIETGDITCGFLLVDTQAKTGYFTGDGFRQDRGGEGGAGYRTAELLLQLFRAHIADYISVPELEKITEENQNKCIDILRDKARESLRSLFNTTAYPNLILSDTQPPYIRT